MKKKILAVAALIFALSGACIQANDSGDTVKEKVSDVLQNDNFRSIINKSFDANAIKSMEISTVSADVRVTGDASGKATVEVLAKGANNRSLSAAEIQQRLNKYYRIITELNGSKLNVKVEFKTNHISNNEGLSLKFILHTPAGANASISTVSGDVDLTRAARADIKTTSGDIEASSLTGDAAVSSVSGDIRIKSVRGSFSGSTTSGNIEAGTVGALMEARSVSGDINVAAGRLGQDVKVKTVSGDVKLNITEKAGMDLHLNTLSGDMDIDGLGAVDYETKSERVVSAKVNGGGKRLGIETVSGDIQISRK